MMQKARGRKGILIHGWNSRGTIQGKPCSPDRIERPKPKPKPKPDFIDEGEFQV